MFRFTRLAAAVVAAAALVAGPVAPAGAAPDAPGSFTIDGSGYGHGVGMAQYGAYQLAREGSSSARILGHYYSGTRTGLTSSHGRAAATFPGPG